jgi:NADH:ubiquinone oxidoreductase subunit B-like Fe-S oxidoreductase
MVREGFGRDAQNGYGRLGQWAGKRCLCVVDATISCCKVMMKHVLCLEKLRCVMREMYSFLIE